MNSIILLISLLLIWVMVLTGLYQRIFIMPKWFENPPASFDRIREQSKTSKKFWIPLTILFILSLIAALILNWQFTGTRYYIIGAFACFITSAILSGSYFIKEVVAFSKIPADSPQTPELLKRTRFWLKWTSVRDILQFLTGVFVALAYILL